MVEALHTNQQSDILTTKVVSEFEGSYIVKMGEERLKCSQAISCLVKPEVGDKVMVLMGEENYILSVLSREKGSVKLSTSRPLVLESSEDIALVAKKRLNMHADTLEAGIREATYRGEKVTMFSNMFEGNINIFKTIGQLWSNTFDKLIQRANHSERIIKGHDEHTCGSSRQSVEGLHMVSSQNHMHIAKEQMKFDAEKIHLA